MIRRTERTDHQYDEIRRHSSERTPRFSVLRRKLLGDYNETPRTPRSGRIINNADNLPPGHIAGYDFNTPEGIALLLAPLGEIQRTDPQYDDISSDPSGFPKLLTPHDVRVLILAWRSFSPSPKVSGFLISVSLYLSFFLDVLVYWSGTNSSSRAD